MLISFVDTFNLEHTIFNTISVEKLQHSESKFQTHHDQTSYLLLQIIFSLLFLLCLFELMVIDLNLLTSEAEEKEK